VRLRADSRLDDEAQLLLRLGNDRDPVMALRLALLSAPLYRVVRGYERAGAVTVSALVVNDDREAAVLAKGEGYEAFGLASVRRLRSLGYELVATEIVDDGLPLPFSNRHVDVIVCTYPESEELYEPTLPKADRKRVREQVLPAYEAALEAFEPRHQIEEE
jgi:hypothetical protein